MDYVGYETGIGYYYLYTFKKFYGCGCGCGCGLFSIPTSIHERSADLIFKSISARKPI